MKCIVLAALAAPLIAAAPPSEQFGESCSGSETITIANAPPKVVPYRLDFSVDLALQSYCYAQCLPSQTYAIADPASTPLKLADLDRGGQVRQTIFDRATEKLTDFQIYSVLGKIERNASATCKAAPFHPMEKAR